MTVDPAIIALNYVTACVFFIFGSLLGSFTNVVILRMAREKSVVFPPSSCPFCNHRLSPIDLIPIFGWILLRGKCRYCSAPILIQYPLVETMVALILASTFLGNGFSPRFIPVAAGTVIWLVVSVMHLRGETESSQPFVWAVIYRFILSGWEGINSLEIIGVVIGIAGIATAILAVRKGSVNIINWFGVCVVGLASSCPMNLYWGAIVLVPSIIHIAWPNDAARHKFSSRALFVLNIFGIFARIGRNILH